MKLLKIAGMIAGATVTLIGGASYMVGVTGEQIDRAVSKVEVSLKAVADGAAEQLKTHAAIVGHPDAINWTLRQGEIINVNKAAIATNDREIAVLKTAFTTIQKQADANSKKLDAILERLPSK